MKDKTRIKLSYGISLFFILIGLVFNYFKIGEPNFQIYGSVGNWLVYIGFIGIIIATIRKLSKKQKKIDERMEFVAAKSLRFTFLFLIIGAFFIMVVDGIKIITLPYHLFMSYLVCVLLLVYMIIYKILLRNN